MWWFCFAVAAHESDKSTAALSYTDISAIFHQLVLELSIQIFYEIFQLNIFKNLP